MDLVKSCVNLNALKTNEYCVWTYFILQFYFQVSTLNLCGMEPFLNGPVLASASAAGTFSFFHFPSGGTWVTHLVNGSS